MADNVKTEKLTLNINAADLAAIDLLVEQGFYRNRTDFMQQALHSRLDSNSAQLAALLQRKESANWAMGIIHLGNDDLSRYEQERRMVSFTVYGMLVVADDIDLTLLKQVVQNIKVYGIVRAPKTVKSIYQM
ncbi:hypothetical protein [Lacticaseibacillus hulanensis]|uniref:hypothetical protein n=1 Tax=Lacticaseibacillus hulanensis TaxID=2493111 RepID=UPI000FD7A051|nr:hypothetical protein [Lacticaseibacillus hulanensis]